MIPLSVPSIQAFAPPQTTADSSGLAFGCWRVQRAPLRGLSTWVTYGPDGAVPIAELPHSGAAQLDAWLGLVEHTGSLHAAHGQWWARRVDIQSFEVLFLSNAFVSSGPNRVLLMALDGWVELLDALTDPICLEKDSVVLRGNRAFADLAGKNVKEIAGTPLGQCLASLGIQSVDLQAGRKELRSTDGSRFFELSSHPTHARPGVTTHMFRDITERKRAESLAEAVSLMDSLGSLFLTLRHELGNPINGVKMALSVMDVQWEAMSKAELKGFLERSLSDLGRVEFLLKNLRTFSMADEGNPERTDLRALLEEVARLLEAACQRERVAFELVAPPQPVMVRLDSRGLTQVMLNLCSNALDALRGRSDGLFRVELVARADSAELRVSDNGAGMTTDQQSRLFQPLETRKTSGSGLGLVIVKRLLTRMGALVEVDSTVGRGTRFRILVPREMQKAPA